jgi:hypothetical protein
MTESVLTITTSTEAGHRIDDHMLQCDAAGSTFANDGTVMLLVDSAGAKSPILTVVYAPAKTCPYGVSHSRTYTCTLAQMHLIGPFSTGHFNDDTGLVHITWSETDASTMCLAFKKGATMG